MNSEPQRIRFFRNVPVGTFFTVPGYDNLFQKVDGRRAKNHGCGALSNPTRLGRKGNLENFQDDTEAFC